MQKTKAQMKSEQAHKKFLKKMGYTGKLSKKSPLVVQPSETIQSNLPKLSNKIPVGVASKREPNVYSGERRLLGIATMHKSNMVPVFSQEDAESISKMGR